MTSDIQSDAVIFGGGCTVIADAPCDDVHQVNGINDDAFVENCNGAADDVVDHSARNVAMAASENTIGDQYIGDNCSQSITDATISSNSDNNHTDSLQPSHPRPTHRSEDTTRHHHHGRKTQRTNYASAAVSTLGNNSDRMDFCGRASGHALQISPTRISSVKEDDGDEECCRSIRSMSEDDTNSVVSFKKIRNWFSSSSSPEKGMTAHDGDYYQFTSPNHGKSDLNTQFPSIEGKSHVVTEEGNDTKMKSSLNDNKFDEAFLNDEARNGQKKQTKRPWIQKSKEVQHLAGTEEEERVMGECSFFYNNIDETNMAMTHMSRPQALHGRDVEEDGYLENPQDLQRHRNRRLDPSTLTHVIKTRAKRQWTERRYRRRLRQSQLEMISFDGTDNRNATAPKNRFRRLRDRRDDIADYWRTKEHQQAFLAAHSALNGKLEYEHQRFYHRNQEYDVDDYYDLELALTQEVDDEGGGGEDTRAYVTKSSLAIRGGLIRLPTDNVRLVCDPMLQPGILSIETRAYATTSGGSAAFDNSGSAKRYQDITDSGFMMSDNRLSQLPPLPRRSKNDIGNSKLRIDSSIDALDKRRWRQPIDQKQQLQQQQQHWSRQELAYVLTVDERIYQRVVQEMGDSYRIPCGLYYCCHVTTGGDHVGIGVAWLILSLIFILLVAGLIAWPTA